MIVFIGDRESARPYSLFGFRVYSPLTAAEAGEILVSLPEETSAVFITEDFFLEIRGMLAGLKVRAVAVPGAGGGRGAGAAYMRELLRKALGTEPGSREEGD